MHFGGRCHNARPSAHSHHGVGDWAPPRSCRWRSPSTQCPVPRARCGCRSASARSLAALAAARAAMCASMAAASTPAAPACKGLGLRLQQTQAGAQCFEQPGQLCRLAAVDFCRQLEQHGHRLGRAKVFVHGCLETGRVGIAPIDGLLLRLHHGQRGVQALERTARIVQMDIGIIERAAVMATHHEETHHLRGSYSLSTSRIVKKFPNDLDIFSLSVIKPLCIHVRAKRLARGAFALRDLVFHGAGRPNRHRHRGCRNSLPTRHSPRQEHSMCQPGRPAPKGLFHFTSAGSSALADFQKHKVQRITARLAQRHVRPHSSSSSDLPDNLP